MARIIDITGELYSGMWSYGSPFPSLEIKPLAEVEWVKYDIYAEVFEGLNSQSGTYLETPAHLLGEASYPLIDVPVEKLVDIPCVVLNVGNVRGEPITRQMLENCKNADKIQEGCAILVCAQYGEKWKDGDYLASCPYFTREAMDWLISKKPFLLGSDFPRWDNLEKPQGFWLDFYNADILMLAPVVNIEEVDSALLTVLPIKAAVTSCAPCRAILKV
ncbi:MAG: cyclase family protein [Oscillospiraceae bacterium]|nr:cyclase family protein [Oscillospiraceae bacterium]